MHKTIILVEGESDKLFFENYFQYDLNKREANVKDKGIFDFQLLGGSDGNKLTLAFESIKTDLRSKPINKIGLILDLDDNNEKELIEKVNSILQKVYQVSEFNSNSFAWNCQLMNKHFTVYLYLIDSILSVNNLEEFLQEIVTVSPVAANCLVNWKDCCAENNRRIKNADFIKFWREVYVRYDYCADEKLRKHAIDNCTVKKSFENIVTGTENPAWNFESEKLTGINLFIQKLLN